MEPRRDSRSLDWFKKPFPCQGIFDYYREMAEKLKPPKPVHVPGPRTVLEGEFGFLKVFCTKWDETLLTHGLGEEFRR